MKFFYSFLSLGIILSFTSCSGPDESLFYEKPQLALNNIQSETRSDANILTFGSDAELKSVIDSIKTKNTSEEKSDWMHENYPSFTSIQDINEQAAIEMGEMENPTLEQCETFIDKYKSLYFPRYEEDGGFYIPIKDLDVSFLANQNCELIVAGEKRCLRDIYDYPTLMQTGRAYYSIANPMAIATATEFYMYNNTMNSVGEEYDSGWTSTNGKRIKLKARHKINFITVPGGAYVRESLMHLEFCFRKKTALGWTNYSSKSTTEFTADIPGLGKYGPLTFENNGTSSHDNEFGYPILITQDNVYRYYSYPEVTYHAKVDYRGVPDVLNYTWTMVPCYCKQPVGDAMWGIAPSYR